MRKILLLFVAIFLVSACHHGHCAEKQVNILAATFPVWLFTANICQDIPDVRLELLIPASAGCPHDFALRPSDMQKLSRAQILVINGAGLEEFLTKPLDGLEHKPAIIDAGVGLPLLDGHGSINPHVFAAPGEAAKMVEQIGKRLAELDPPHAGKYLENAQTYGNKLANLSAAFQKVGAKAANPRIAIEHDALAYLVTNAGLVIVAELEPGSSPAVMARIRAVLTQNKPGLLAGDAQYADRVLKTLADELQLPFAVLDPCASGPESAPPDYYESTMKENLRILEKYFE